MSRPPRCARRIRGVTLILVTVAAAAVLLAAPWTADRAEDPRAGQQTDGSVSSPTSRSIAVADAIVLLTGLTVVPRRPDVPGINGVRAGGGLQVRACLDR